MSQLYIFSVMSMSLLVFWSFQLFSSYLPTRVCIIDDVVNIMVLNGKYVTCLVRRNIKLHFSRLATTCWCFLLLYAYDILSDLNCWLSVSLFIYYVPFIVLRCTSRLLHLFAVFFCVKLRFCNCVHRNLGNYFRLIFFTMSTFLPHAFRFTNKAPRRADWFIQHDLT